MVGRRILYALALAGAALFFLFYEAWISLFTLVLVLALPVAPLALSLPLARKLRPELLPRDIFFYDTIYKRTKLYAYAEEHGIPAANGLSMLLHQGAKSLSIWTGLEAPVEVMRKALLGAARI